MLTHEEAERAADLYFGLGSSGDNEAGEHDKPYTDSPLIKEEEVLLAGLRINATESSLAVMADS